MNYAHLRIWLFIISLGIIILPAMGATLTIDNATLEIGETTQIGFTIDQVPIGHENHNSMTISLEDPEIMEIISVSFPRLTARFNSSLPADYVVVSHNFPPQYGYTNVTFLNVTIRADALGTTRIIIQEHILNPEYDPPILTVIQGGYLTIIEPDTVPPGSITDLHNTTYQQNIITWAWSDPLDLDFDKVIVYINGIFTTNVTKGTQSYTASPLTGGTRYTIGTKTVDNNGNINSDWVNSSAWTKVNSGIVPFPNKESYPLDLDMDGLYEDINGNERMDFNDIVLYFLNMSWIGQNEPVQYFDYNKNGRIDFNDVVLLFKEI